MTNIPQPFVLFDPETGECPTPTDLLKNIDSLTDDEVLDLLDRAATLQTELNATVAQLKNTVIHRMTADGATLYDSPLFEAKLEKKVTYAYNIPHLMALKPHLTGEQFDKAIKMEPKVSKVELNKLVKLGGPIKAIIDEAVAPVDGPPTLTYSRKPA